MARPRLSGEWWWADPGQLRGQVEENLRQLGRNHLDVVNLRLPRNRASDSLADHFGALAELREAGLIRHLGVSTPDRHEVLRLCGESGIAFVPYYAIAREGRDAGATGAYEPALVEVAREHGASPAQIRVAWTLHQGEHVLAIPGTSDPAHLEANIAAAAIRLTADDLTRLAEG